MELNILKPQPPDVFDRVAGPDIFDRTELSPTEKILHSPAFERLVADHVSRAVAQIKVPEAPPAPPKETIIKETRVEVQVQKKDARDLVERSELEEAHKKIAELEKKLESTDKAARSPIIVGGPGVIGIPPPESAQVAQVLTVNANKKAEWKAATAAGGGASLSGFTVTNHNQLLALDESSITLNQLARLVGTIIGQLQP